MNDYRSPSINDLKKAKWTHIIGNTDFIDLSWSYILAYHISENSVVLVDSGAWNSPGLFEELEKRRLTVRAVLCSHLHPDHIANNFELVKRYGTEIFASEPEIETAIRDKWPVKPSAATITPVPMEETSVLIEGSEFRFIPTDGHSNGHMAVVTPDDVCFLGDAVMTKDRLRISKLPYMSDIDKALESMQRMLSWDHICYVCAHKGVVPHEKMPELIRLNMEKEDEIYGVLNSLITGPVQIDELNKRLMSSLKISEDSQHYPGIASTSKERIFALQKKGEILIKDGIVSRAGGVPGTL